MDMSKCLIALAAFGLLASCSTLDTKTPAPLLVLSAPPSDVVTLALADGKLAERDGCLTFKTRGGPVTPYFSSNFQPVLDGGRVVAIEDGRGHRIALKTRVRFYSSNTSDNPQEYLTAPIPATCPKRYVHLQQLITK
ncbi:hypothetical protein [Lysobacter sp. CA196]|uniref:hypothetical protein n=1 Tax=Lysobacter sp. CA196 TaxID=3455606 RepID=UPI003F8D0625